MNSSIQHYRSEDGEHYFTFKFTQEASHIAIHVLAHPGFNGQDEDPHKTHLLQGGKLCLVVGQEPRDMNRALELAKQWAEYCCVYRTSGTPQQ